MGFLLVPTVLVALSSCGSDDPQGPPDPPDILLDVTAAEVNAVDQAVRQLNDALQSFVTLASTITPVMTGPTHNPNPDVALLGQRRAADQLRIRALAETRLRRETAAGTDLALLAALAPLGATCFWDFDDVNPSGFWIPGEPIFGPVANDRTRFELYETLGEEPTVPLEDETFSDVVLRQQSDDPAGGPFSTEIYAEQAGIERLRAPTTGTGSFSASSFVWNARTENGLLSDGSTDMSYEVDWDSGPNGLVTSFRANSGGLTLEDAFGAEQRNMRSVTTSQTVEFRMQFADSGNVTSGSVLVDNETVANITGDVFEPQFSLSPGSRLPSSQLDELGSIFTDLQNLSFGADFLLLTNVCVGSRQETFCE
jgi:hypothetical protein